MVYSSYKKQRIVHFHTQGFKVPTIVKLLPQENLTSSRTWVGKFSKHYVETGGLGKRPGSGRPAKIMPVIKELVDKQMRRDDETTAYQLHQMLTQLGYVITLRTVLCCRTTLGWTFRGSAYCQLIRNANKQKRQAFAHEQKWLVLLVNISKMTSKIYHRTDECTVQMESHCRFCCRKRREAPRPKPKFVSNELDTL